MRFCQSLAAGKRPILHGEGDDAFSGWRRVIKVMYRTGVRSAIKRRFRRLERRAAKMMAGQFLLLTLVLFGCSPQPTPSTLVALEDSYNRADWGYWVDADKDCQDTRQEVLIRQSLIPVTLDVKGCRVVTGQWKCPYTGKVITDPSLLDVDHAVPLHEAYNSGGATWDAAQKSAFTNFLGPGHLKAVDRSANRSKGSRQPHEWLPPDEFARCQYVKDWLNVKRQWNLSTDCEEAQNLATLVALYCF
jgi:hypothetical protein